MRVSSFKHSHRLAELGIGVDEAVKIKQTLAKFADGGGVKAHETSALDMLRV